MPRELSEAEFNAIRERVVQSAPDGLDEAGFERYKGPALAQAVGEAENTPERPQRGAVGRFAEAILPSMTPSDYVSGPVRSIAHPIDSFNLVKDAVKSDPVGAIPIVGPLRNAGREAMSGNLAGAAGHLTNAALPFAMKGVRVPAGQAARATLKPPGTALNAAGRGLDTFGKSQFAEKMGAYSGISGLSGAATAVGMGNPGAALAIGAGGIVGMAAPAMARGAGKVMQIVGRKMNGPPPVSPFEGMGTIGDDFKYSSPLPKGFDKSGGTSSGYRPGEVLPGPEPLIQGAPTMPFGRNRGTPVTDVDAGYIDWLSKQEKLDPAVLDMLKREIERRSGASAAPAGAAEELARLLGTPSDAQMKARIGQHAETKRWPEP